MGDEEGARRPRVLKRAAMPAASALWLAQARLFLAVINNIEQVADLHVQNFSVGQSTSAQIAIERMQSNAGQLVAVVEIRLHCLVAHPAPAANGGLSNTAVISDVIKSWL